jgi:OOP family OmpA-OmpF porin
LPQKFQQKYQKLIFGTSNQQTSFPENPMRHIAIPFTTPKLPRAFQALLLACAVAALSACGATSNPAPTSPATPREISKVDALADPFSLTSNAVVPTQSRIIFYRPLDSASEGASSIYINGRYHASLVPGGYSLICITPGPAQLGLRHLDVQKRPNKDGFDSITEMTAMGGKNQYVRVRSQNGKAIVLVPVTEQQALKELPSTRLQVHTISRVAEATECVDAPATAPTAPIAASLNTERLQLSFDTLFAFNRSDSAGLTQQGLRAIEQLLNQIRDQFSRVETVRIIGHADPIGDARANDALSTARAKTIRDVISARSSNTIRITSEGRGERELAVTQCTDQPTPANIACNQPNRRVSIEVTGIKR